jgi:hypothetical protein
MAIMPENNTDGVVLQNRKMMPLYIVYHWMIKTFILTLLAKKVKFAKHRKENS